MREDAGQESLDAVYHAPEIDVHNPVPMVVCRELQRPSEPYASVVAQHVNLAEDALGLAGRARHRPAIGDVEFYGVNRAGAVERSYRLIKMVAPDVGDHHIHALADEHLRHTQANAAGPASDKRNFVFHVFHIFFPNGKWNLPFISRPADLRPGLRLRHTAAVWLHAEPDDERAQRTQYESSHREREPDLTLRVEDIIR